MVVLVVNNVSVPLPGAIIWSYAGGARFVSIFYYDIIYFICSRRFEVGVQYGFAWLVVFDAVCFVVSVFCYHGCRSPRDNQCQNSEAIHQ